MNPHPITEAATWGDLADALGTTPRTIERWRARFGQQCPQPHAGRHSVAAWTDFALIHGLRPANNFDLAAARPARFTSDEKRGFLFEILELLDAALADGKIDVAEYLDAGANLLEPLLETGRDWNAGIDDPAYRARWKGQIERALA